MCGIAGIVNLENKTQVRINIIKEMADTMIHRGPDDSGSYVDDCIALGHRRLTIIDLTSHGRQPMFDITGRVGIIFNGEIYNYQELRSELETKGYEFQSQTDTEVILNAYIEYGIKCLNKFNGMFAFGIYDKKYKTVYLVRDRIGIKPLFYSLYDGKLIFASEIKAILKYPGFSSSENINGLSSYLSYRYPIGEDTLFNEIKSLNPGYYLEVAGPNVKKHQYWEIPINENNEDKGEEFYINRLREIMASAVKYRMRSDVHVGAYLSGGLDSSITVALMSNFMESPVNTFTIGFNEEGYNEFRFAKQVADKYNTNHNRMTMSSTDYIENMVKLISYKDAPLGVPNEPALYVMSKELKKYVTVVLSGEGADEIFGGYGRIFRSPYDYQRLKELENSNNTSNSEKNKLLRRNLDKKYNGNKFKSDQEHFLFLYNYTNWDDKQNFLHPDIIKHLNYDEQLRNIFAVEFEKIKNMNIYDKYMWIFEKIHILGLLQRVDMTTMAASVEARVPFVDHRLVEFAFTIPIKYKLKWRSQTDKATACSYNSDQISEKYDIPKYILKKSFENDLPKEVVWRKKMGFPVPVHNWLGDDFNDFSKEILLDKRALNRNFYNKNMEKILNNKQLFSNHGFGIKIWMLVNMELWQREYIDKN
ncbi:MAG: asparagine synthase (glutamine-hydrolyzing) [Bacteroidetes bacterium]|nr:asparagine synthase (glutamine-hydrolyzing) [Bacteroidota bacterium]